ncbi:MFS transporter [Inquilinus sp. CA228]|uniref:MFS transporter n=1 Tax=Inquilinus sp. CA228 TaxID=3455609 RepID=UPI003F8D8D15
MSDEPLHAASASPATLPSAWSAFRHRPFAVLWVATVVSNIGGWMYNAASGWLMTGLDPDPLIVSLVQVATALPMFLFALPAGALADIVDRRRLLIVMQIVVMLLSAAFALLVSAGAATPWLLLAFTFLVGIGGALVAPAWQAIVPRLVPPADLQPAVTLNSLGINISRAVGPALAGLVIAALGIAAPFWLNAVSYAGVILALLWWRPAPQSTSRLPAERFGQAIRNGLRHARRNARLRATLVRAIGFFLFASSYWAVLPLVAREQVAGGPELYGLLLGAIGAGAVGGAFLLPLAKARLGADRMVAAGAAGTAIALALYAVAREPAVAMIASVLAGLSWISVLSPLNVSAQMALPEWVRARGLAVFVTAFFGAMTAGSMIWGQTAAWLGLPAALAAAAAGTLLAIPLTWRWKLQAGAGADMTPSMHWPEPVLSHQPEPDRGPVMITVEYRIDPTSRVAFLAALERFAGQRRRDGAFAWCVFEDAAEDGRLVETFMVESWIEHLRQHERVTNSDRVLQDAVHQFHIAGQPKVEHLIAAQR